MFIHKENVWRVAVLILPEKVLRLIDSKSSADRAHWVEEVQLLPKTKGSYALNLQIPNSTTIKVGALGSINFDAGGYIYVGSAMGSGGLSARVGRHFNQANNKKKRWHIDYIKSEMSVVGCWIFEHKKLTMLDKTSNKQTDYMSNISECELAQAFIDSGYVTYKKVGSSDCQCLGHFMKVAL